MNSHPQSSGQSAQTLDQRTSLIYPIPVRNWIYYTDEDFVASSRPTGFYYFQNDNEEDDLPEIATEEDFHRFLFDLTSRETSDFRQDTSQYREIIKKYAHWIPPVGQNVSSSITFDDAEESLDSLNQMALEARLVAAKAIHKGEICCGMHQEPKWDDDEREESEGEEDEESEEEEEMTDNENDTTMVEEHDGHTAKEELQNVGGNL
ncbi:hypothetical protein BZA77DRAFT_302050 [Pyronema omphalodes]|nr:hypothetical protein BZA77DRAFT_302050 [Pyronema omphalodes]